MENSFEFLYTIILLFFLLSSQQEFPVSFLFKLHDMRIKIHLFSIGIHNPAKNQDAGVHPDFEIS